jgi:23S rRNA pseudouridine2605 synthase
MTNDGDLTFRLTHPRFGHEKEYRVLVARHPDQQQLLTWRRGVVLEDGDKTAPAQVWVEAQAGKGAWLRVVMGEGRKRQIREIGALIGLPVVRIVRVRIGTLLLGGLKPGDWRNLTGAEVAALKGDRPAPVRTAKGPTRGAPRSKPARAAAGRPRASAAGKKPRPRRPK